MFSKFSSIDFDFILKDDTDDTISQLDHYFLTTNQSCCPIKAKTLKNLNFKKKKKLLKPKKKTIKNLKLEKPWINIELMNSIERRQKPIRAL